MRFFIPCKISCKIIVILQDFLQEIKILQVFLQVLLARVSVSLAAFLSSCVSSFTLCSNLLSTYCGASISISSIPGKDIATSCLSASLSGTPVLEVPASQFSKAQQFYQFQLDTYQSNLLLSSCSLCDQARIRAISSHSCASACMA